MGSNMGQSRKTLTLARGNKRSIRSQNEGLSLPAGEGPALHADGAILAWQPRKREGLWRQLWVVEGLPMAR